MEVKYFVIIFYSTVLCFIVEDLFTVDIDWNSSSNNPL